MRFSSNIYDLAKSELKKRQTRAEELADTRRKQLCVQFPELTDVENEMKNSALEVIKGISEGRATDIHKLAEKNLEAQKRRAEILTAAGYPGDYLEPQYSCKKCNDKGEYEGKICECQLKLLKQLASEGLSCSPILSVSTFETFDLKYYSDKRDAEKGYSPREYMSASYNMLKAYADSFTKKSGSFYFCGATGLGKTHLALAVMNVVSENGFNVYYGTAGSIIKEMEKEHFGRGSGDIDEQLENSDLLIIDDLGTEFKTSFSQSAVQEIINNAILCGKPMIICSNLSREGIEKEYGERVASRLNAFEIIEFIGTDIRQLKK